MIAPVILDTGPLVAFLDRRDQFHDWSIAQFNSLNGYTVSCEAVISEACFVADHNAEVVAKISSLLNRGTIRLEFSLAAHYARVFSLMEKYSNLPMSLADACLVCMAEDRSHSKVLTTDSDFSIYRLHGRKPVPRIAP